MYFSTTILLAASAITLAAPALGAPTPNDVFINGFTYAGSGCPPLSVANATDDSKSVLTLIYSSYFAQIGPGTLPADRRKNCQVNLDVHYPQGWQYSIFSVDFRGFRDIERYVTGKQVASYYFSGSSSTITATSTFVGPQTGDYQVSDSFDVKSLVWSPCGANVPLNVNSQVYLTSTRSSANGLLTTDSTDFKFTQVYHIQWRRC